MKTADEAMSVAEYMPITGPLPGEQYEPSNAAEDRSFQESWCYECARDKEMNGTCEEEGREPEKADYCPILSARYRGQADEWRRLPDGRLTCLAFTPRVAEPVETRCEYTIDMFPPWWHAFSKPERT